MQFLKRLIKIMIAMAAYYTGFVYVSHIIKKILGIKQKPIILLYHRILDNNDKAKALLQPGMCVTQATFDGQIKYLSRHYRIITFGELVTLIKNKAPIPDRTVVITFDDGWKDNYYNAYPILKKYNAPAIIFLSTDMIEYDRLPVFNEISIMLGESEIWPRRAVDIFRRVVRENHLQESIPEIDDDRLSSIENNSMRYMTTLMLLDCKYMEQIASEMRLALCSKVEESQGRHWAMSWQQVKEMNANGIDFGSHGKSHELLIRLPKECVKDELGDSKRIIENELGKPVDYFAYPNHDFNEEITRLVEESGYLGAGDGYVESNDHSNYDIFALERFNVNEGATAGPLGNFSKAIFARKMAGRL